jgi:proteasome lid subunit RPN8/RPN11
VLDPSALAAAKAYMIRQYPKEGCGLVIGTRFQPVNNISTTPRDDFEMRPDAWIRFGEVAAVLHSHIVDRHQPWPSAADINRQQETRVPWGIVFTGKDSASDPLWFGDQILDQPLIGRQFVTNVTDCWQLVRAYFWQQHQVKIGNPGTEANFSDGADHFTEVLPGLGFKPIAAKDVAVGDVCTMTIRTRHPNHIAVLVEPGIFLHHLNLLFSRRDAAHRWQPLITQWYRYAP